MGDPFLAIRQAIQERPAHPYSLRPETQRLDNVRAASYTAVEIDFALIKHLRSEAAQFKQGV